jgi:hypothetical protein
MAVGVDIILQLYECHRTVLSDRPLPRCPSDVGTHASASGDKNSVTPSQMRTVYGTQGPTGPGSVRRHGLLVPMVGDDEEVAGGVG